MTTPHLSSQISVVIYSCAFLWGKLDQHTDMAAFISVSLFVHTTPFFSISDNLFQCIFKEFLINAHTGRHAWLHTFQFPCLWFLSTPSVGLGFLTRQSALESWFIQTSSPCRESTPLRCSLSCCTGKSWSEMLQRRSSEPCGIRWFCEVWG